MLTLGLLGAALSVAFLLLIPTDDAAGGYGRLFAQPLPIVVFVAAVGFGIGALVAVLWSLTQRLFAPHVPPA